MTANVLRFSVAAGALFIASANTPIPRSVVLQWNPNSETDLAGYRLYTGLRSGEYQWVDEVGMGTNTTVEGLFPGMTYFFVLTAYNTAGLESDPSNEVNYTALGCEVILLR